MTGPAALSRSGCGAFAFLGDGRAHGARCGAEPAQFGQHNRIVHHGGETLRAAGGSSEPCARGRAGQVDGGGGEKVAGVAVGVLILTGATPRPPAHRQGAGTGLLVWLRGPDRGQQAGVTAQRVQGFATE